MERRTRILILSQYETGGFYRGAWSIVVPLAGRFDLHYLGIGAPAPCRSIQGIRLHPNPRTAELFADLDDLTSRLRPEIIFVVHAVHVVARVARMFAGRQHRPALVGYFPIEGHIRRAELLAPLRTLDRLVVYNAHARQEVAPHLPAADRDPGDSASSRLRIIPLGLDHELFRPSTAAGDRARCRRARAQWLPHRPELQDAFLVLNGNDAVSRKRLDITLWGFADFARDKPPGVYLYLHRAGPGHPRWNDLRSLAERLGILDRLIPTTEAGARGVLKDEQLRQIYNACEVGVNTSMAEGWGLVSFEHAATGAAQIVPGHSGFGHTWGGAAQLLAPRSRLRVDRNLEMDVVPSSELTTALEKLYADPLKLEQWSKAAYERAARAWSWSAVSNRFAALFEELAG